MSRFVVAIFPSLSSAGQGIRTLKELAVDDIIHLHGAATVTKDESSRLTMTVVADDGPAVSATGALIGGVAGLAIGPLAAAILAMGGAVFGASAGLTNRGAGIAHAKRIAQDIPPGSTAVVADVTAEDITVLLAQLESVGGKVTRQE